MGRRVTISRLWRSLARLQDDIMQIPDTHTHTRPLFKNRFNKPILFISVRGLTPGARDLERRGPSTPQKSRTNGALRKASLPACLPASGRAQAKKTIKLNEFERLLIGIGPVVAINI